MKHSARLSTCTKLSPVSKTFFPSIFEWSYKTGFTVCPIMYIIGGCKKTLSLKLRTFSYPSNKFWVLIETVLFRTHNICFGREIRKLDFHYALLSMGLSVVSYSVRLEF